MNEYPLLCSPLAAGRLRLRNRVVMTAMTTGFGYQQGVPDDDLIAYFASRSGDIALATVGFGAVRPEGRVEDKIPWMWREDIAERLAPLVEAIRARGALASLQLGHGGRQVAPAVIGTTPVAPSPLPPLVHVRTPPHELTVTEIDEIIAAFALAACRAASAGFDAVEVHAGHGYLIHEFLSADANRRTDGYGGPTIAQRARFGVEVIAAVRAAAPGIGVIARINGTDLYPEGLGPADAAQVGALFAAAGADALLVSAGVYGTVPYTIPLLDDEETPYLSAAAHVRAHVTVPVIAVGGFSRPAVAEAALARGDCDAIAIGRALIADPDWLAKAREDRTAQIRPCVATVDACAGMLGRGEAISCSVNPEVGRERRAAIPRAERPRRLAIVGLGPAGLEAACRAAELGHEVIAFEQGERVGGAAALAGRTPTLQRYGRLIAWYERRLELAGVEPLLGVRADGERLAGCEAELVIVATGAVTDPPAIDGYDELAAWQVEDLLEGRPSTLAGSGWPSRPVIVGDGRVAAATALALARQGAECTLLARGRVAGDASGLARRAYVSRLERLGIRRLRGYPTRLAAGGVWWQADGSSQETLAQADGVVLADRRRPERPAGMAAVAADVVRVGDARVVRDLTAAIAEGREAAEAFARLGAARAGR